MKKLHGRVLVATLIFWIQGRNQWAQAWAVSYTALNTYTDRPAPASERRWPVTNPLACREEDWLKPLTTQLLHF